MVASVTVKKQQWNNFQSLFMVKKMLPQNWLQGTTLMSKKQTKEKDYIFVWFKKNAWANSSLTKKQIWIITAGLILIEKNWYIINVGPKSYYIKQ